MTDLAALLDHRIPPWRSTRLPPFGHWFYFHPAARQSVLGGDGHPQRADDILYRRMWAGSRVELHRPVSIGSTLRRETRTIAETRKTGRSGEMLFVTLAHRLIDADGGLAITEEQDIVYRAGHAAGSSRPGAPHAAAENEGASRTVVPNETALFRFSALTFNAHRIHYDLPYTKGVEGYPALVVQGPFIATLLLDDWLRRNPGAAPSRFSFRAERPAFCNNALALCVAEDQGEARLTAVDADGRVVMRMSLQS